MDPMLAYCGLDCSGCPIYLATLERDVAKKATMRSHIARLLKERYSLNLEAENVGDCDGCRSNRLFVTCAACEIRRCAREKDLASCAFCDRFACENLLKIFLEDSAARQRLEKLQNIV
jgi:hypothetical protein